MINLYKFLGYLFIPLILLNTLFRIIINKEDSKRVYERFGFTNFQKPQGKLIWIHAASVGEFKSASKLIDILYNKYNLLITTTTLTASNYAKKNFNKKIIHQFAPFDVSFCVNRFLNKWKPDCVIWIESDLWPITLNLIKRKSINSLLVNSRISPKSFKKWKFFKSFFTSILSSFEEIYAQSILDKERIEFLSKRKIKFMGNLKLSFIEKKNELNISQYVKKYIDEKKIIMFASTHHNEEKILFSTIKNFVSKGFKVFIAPRHPERSSQIKKFFKQKNIDCDTIDSTKQFKDINIINSLGEMTFFYDLCDIVILGGSFVNKGGHNPIEVAHNNCVVITGPNIYNWENIYLEMLEIKGCYIVYDVKELNFLIAKLLNNQNDIVKLKNNAKRFAIDNFQKSQKLLNQIENFVKNIDVKSA
ncbi:MAG: 3-deoxy-D-manno-octulosonic acid transferase [Alphaproteobacteria bacterium MarineAlpha5_Bin9]|nr:MAG: 3-deoxy-D-manno-octulosonic acid transferase [Alphaproteobacteria bacterium MarineAlpha5_Bin9]|tara:strand:+ start:8419 stop:9672 length:1254 start_codon:yes stop_codon:yes gene_type:complete